MMVTSPRPIWKNVPADRNYDRLMEIVTAVERAGFPVGEVITSYAFGDKRTVSAQRSSRRSPTSSANSSK